MLNEKINIMHFTIDYNENLGAYHFLKKIEQGLLKYNVDQQILILGTRRKQEVHIPNNVYFCDEIDIQQFFHELDRNTILIFHESFATYARNDRSLPTVLYGLSKNFARLRMIHDYSTAVCPMAIDIDKYKMCKGTLNKECLNKNCINRDVYNNFMNSLKSLNNYNGIMCLSKDSINRIIANGVEPDKVFQIPPLIKEETTFQERNKERKIILYASRICAQKGLYYLVRAMSKLKEYNWELLVAGNPEETRYYLNVFRYARKEGVEKRIKILGHLSQDELRKVRKQSDIFCFPSIGSETYGFSGAEAVLAGIPVVAFEIDGVNEWLTDEVTGYLCKYLDVDDMSEKIKVLLTNEKTYEVMRNNCIKAAKCNQYDEQLRKIYEFINKIYMRKHQ